MHGSPFTKLLSRGTYDASQRYLYVKLAHATGNMPYTFPATHRHHLPWKVASHHGPSLALPFSAGDCATHRVPSCSAYHPSLQEAASFPGEGCHLHASLFYSALLCKSLCMQGI